MLDVPPASPISGRESQRCICSLERSGGAAIDLYCVREVDNAGLLQAKGEGTTACERIQRAKRTAKCVVTRKLIRPLCPAATDPPAFHLCLADGEGPILVEQLLFVTPIDVDEVADVEYVWRQPTIGVLQLAQFVFVKDKDLAEYALRRGRNEFVSQQYAMLYR
jgi:hypothetical protein